MRTGRELATLDSELLKAARAAGVTLASAAAAGPTPAAKNCAASVTCWVRWVAVVVRVPTT